MLLLLHFTFVLSVVKMQLKGEVGGRALNSHGNYIVDHRKSWKNHRIVFLAHQSRRLRVSLKYGTGAGVSASVRVSVRASTLSNMNISETSWPIVIKFHLEHHWGGGLAA